MQTVPNNLRIDFLNDTQGFTSAGANLSPNLTTWVSNGGFQQNGSISVTAADVQETDDWYFDYVSPGNGQGEWGTPITTGQIEQYTGGELVFALRNSQALENGTQPDVKLFNVDNAIHYNFPDDYVPQEIDGWAIFRVPLSHDAGWFHSLGDTPTTVETFNEIIINFDGLAIRGSGYSEDNSNALDFVNFRTAEEVASDANGGIYRPEDYDDLLFSLGLGSDASDVLTGTDNSDNLYGGLGDDTIYGHAEADFLFGDAGADRLFGGNGADNFFAGSGDDIVRGGAGNDGINGQSGNDKLFGRIGNDDIHAGAGNDSARGGSGEDTLYGNSDDDKLLGNIGNDSLFGGAGDDSLWGGQNADTLDGASGDDLLVGGKGDDVIFDEFGTNKMSGVGGNDHLTSGGEFAQMYGGLGDDTLTYQGQGSVVMNGGQGSDTFEILGNSATVVVGKHAGADTLIGANTENVDLIIKGIDLETEADAKSWLTEHASVEGQDLWLDIGDGRSLRIIEVIDEENEDTDQVEDFSGFFI